MTAYYNEIDHFAAEWLRNLIREGLIADGDVDERDIRDVLPSDVRGYTQCHWFAGIGGWSYALRLAKWPDDRHVWTGSCPCQPFSAAGKGNGFADERHLWPAWHWLIEQCRPATIFGEQVANATAWLGLVRSDLEALDYAVGAVPIEAASAGAYHPRDRFWFVADSDRRNWNWRDCSLQMGRFSNQAEATQDCHCERTEWPAKSPVSLLAYGVPFRMEQCRAFGNAIDPRSAAEFIAAYMSLLCPAAPQP